MRWLLLLAVLAGCAQQPESLEPALVIPHYRHGCHEAAIDPKPLPPIRTLEQYRQWADATAHARDVDKLALLECEHKLNVVIDTLDSLRQQVEAPGAQ